MWLQLPMPLLRYVQHAIHRYRCEREWLLLGI